jgi:hypothetical protein
MNSYLLILLFTKESGANCNTICVLNIVIAIIIDIIHELKFKRCFLSSLLIHLFVGN